MKMYGVKLAEGSAVSNMVVSSGPDLPNGGTVDKGELFFKTGTNSGLYLYTGAWRRVMIDGADASVWMIGSAATAEQTVLDVTGNQELNGDLLLDTSSKILTWTDANGVGYPGWRDISADLNVKASGTTVPTWAVFRNGLYAWRFSATSMNEIQVNFHLNHDYALGTPIYFHVHWSSASSPIGTGNVRWGFEYIIAKGHGQETFPASNIVYVEQSISTTYQHMVAEISTGITSASLEPDSLVMVRIFRDATHANDTYPNPTFILTADMHYQANTFATKNKAPNFTA